MAKETIWQRRARKRGSAKAEYYPKVDLADEAEGMDPLARVEALAVAEVEAPAEAEDDLAPAAAFETAEADGAEPAVAEAEAPLAEAEAPLAEAEAPLAEAGPVEVLAAEPASNEAAVLEDAPAAEEAPLEEASLAASEPEPAAPADESIRLPEFLDLPAAAPLARSLLERRGKPIVIDGSAVAQVGAQCVQVLLSAKRTWGADGVPLSIVNCAPRMIEDLQLLGIDSATLISGDLPQ